MKIHIAKKYIYLYSPKKRSYFGRDRSICCCCMASDSGSCSLGCLLRILHHSLGHKQYLKGRGLFVAMAKLFNAEKNTKKTTADIEKNNRNISTSCRKVLQKLTIVTGSTTSLEFSFLLFISSNKNTILYLNGRKTKKYYTKII